MRCKALALAWPIQKKQQVSDCVLVFHLLLAPTSCKVDLHTELLTLFSLCFSVSPRPSSGRLLPRHLPPFSSLHPLLHMLTDCLRANIDCFHLLTTSGSYLALVPIKLSPFISQQLHQNDFWILKGRKPNIYYPNPNSICSSTLTTNLWQHLRKYSISFDLMLQQFHFDHFSVAYL